MHIYIFLCCELKTDHVDGFHSCHVQPCNLDLVLQFSKFNRDFFYAIELRVCALEHFPTSDWIVLGFEWDFPCSLCLLAFENVHFVWATTTKVERIKRRFKKREKNEKSSVHLQQKEVVRCGGGGGEFDWIWLWFEFQVKRKKRLLEYWMRIMWRICGSEIGNLNYNFSKLTYQMRRRSRRRKEISWHILWPARRLRWTTYTQQIKKGDMFVPWFDIFYSYPTNSKQTFPIFIFRLIEILNWQHVNDGIIKLFSHSLQ